MFSANKEYLYIPNQKAPNFGLAQILTQTNDLTSGSFLQKNPDGSFNEVDLRPSPSGSEFPNATPLVEGAASKYDDSYSPLTADAYEWGYLKDLYINFDFFIQCMNRNGYVIKDVAIEILNGLSSAVNLFWDFQIINTGSTSKENQNIGDECLIIVDKSFTGKSSDIKRDNLLRLQSIGTNSPFQEFKIKLELGGAMANQIMTQRNSNSSPALTSDIAVETKPESFSGLFAYEPDGVTVVLNTIRATEDIEAAAVEAARINSSQQTQLEKAKAELERKQAEGIATSQDRFNVRNAEVQSGEYFQAVISTFVAFGQSFVEQGSDFLDKASEVVGLDTAAQSKKRATNYEFFMQKAGVYPLINNPNADFAKGLLDFDSSNDVLISSKTLACGIWQDPELLRSFYEYDMNPNPSQIDSYEILQNYLKKSAGYLPIEVNFTIHGVSGIKVGDMIHFIDLPYVYKTKLFTVLRVEQSVTDDMWTTTVDAFCRNIDI
jgi:hypothetical protein